MSLALMPSCGLLDVENVSSIYGDGYWNSKGDVESYMTGIYTSLRDVCNSTLHFEDRGDSFVAGLEGGPSSLWMHNLTSQNGYGWGSYYKTIQHCNMLLKNTPGVEFGKAEEKDCLMAEAYFVRSYMYFCVARVWGDAPIEIEPTEGAGKPKLGRSPAVEVINRALKDVESAISLFPDGIVKGKGKPSRQAAYALKADILLWKAKVFGGTDQDYEDVIEYADLASKGLSLEDDFDDIYGKKKGKEVLWAIHFEYPEKEAHYSKDLKLRDVFVAKAVNMEDVPYAKTGARSTYRPSPELCAMMERYKGDVRVKGSYVTAKDKDGNILGVSDNKMKGTKTETDRTFDSDIIVYRLAELILFKAEAYAALNKIPEAIKELDKVRNRAKIGDYTGATDKKSVELEILDERGRELYLERKRWPDLLRFHYEGVIDVYSVVPNLKKQKDIGKVIPLYLAIPKADMDRNPELLQTAGYENL